MTALNGCWKIYSTENFGNYFKHLTGKKFPQFLWKPVILEIKLENETISFKSSNFYKHVEICGKINDVIDEVTIDNRKTKTTFEISDSKLIKTQKWDEKLAKSIYYIHQTHTLVVDLIVGETVAQILYKRHSKPNTCCQKLQLVAL